MENFRLLVGLDTASAEAPPARHWAALRPGHLQFDSVTDHPVRSSAYPYDH